MDKLAPGRSPVFQNTVKQVSELVERGRRGLDAAGNQLQGASADTFSADRHLSTAEHFVVIATGVNRCKDSGWAGKSAFTPFVASEGEINQGGFKARDGQTAADGANVVLTNVTRQLGELVEQLNQEGASYKESAALAAAARKSSADSAKDALTAACKAQSGDWHLSDAGARLGDGQSDLNRISWDARGIDVSGPANDLEGRIRTASTELQVAYQAFENGHEAAVGGEQKTATCQQTLQQLLAALAAADKN